MRKVALILAVFCLFHLFGHRRHCRACDFGHVQSQAFFAQSACVQPSFVQQSFAVPVQTFAVVQQPVVVEQRVRTVQRTSLFGHRVVTRTVVH